MMPNGSTCVAQVDKCLAAARSSVPSGVRHILSGTAILSHDAIAEKCNDVAQAKEEENLSVSDTKTGAEVTHLPEVPLLPEVTDDGPLCKRQRLA